MTPDPVLYYGPNGAVCCAEHKGSEGWSRLSSATVAHLRKTCLHDGLVALHEPLCECCRAIATKSPAADLTREDA